MKNNNIITTSLVIVALVLGFIGGKLYQSKNYNRVNSKNINDNPMQQREAGQFNRGNRNGNNQGSRPTSGEVISSDDKSLVIKMADGSSKIVILSDQTKYVKTSDVSPKDVSIGKTVMVLGTDNTDGSITASSIQLDPTFTNRQGN